MIGVSTFSGDMAKGEAAAAAAMRMPRSAHFVERQNQRQVADVEVALAITYGERFFEGNDRVYFLGQRRLKKLREQFPGTVDDRTVRRADGTVVVVGEDGNLITTYRNPRFISVLKRRAR